jgi:hypothetical protein
MGSETKGDVLFIHFGNKTNIDICPISLMEKNTSDHCKKNSLVDHIQLRYDRSYEHHTYGSNGDPPGSTASAICG